MATVCAASQTGSGGILVAMWGIGVDQELTTDYALFDDHDEAMQCQCGTRSCRGTIGGRDWQRPDLQRKYGSYFSVYLQRRIDAGPGQRP